MRCMGILTRVKRSERVRAESRTAPLDAAMTHFVYIVRCADGTLYTGYARDPVAREQAHNRGRGAKYTAGRRPVRLVYREAFRSRGEALSREHAVKQLTRAQKNALIVGPKRRRRTGVY